MAALAASSWAACSATETHTFDDSTEGSPAASAGAGGAGGASSAAGTGGEFEFDAGLDDGSFGDDAACAATSVEADPIPLDMLVLLDRSGSMSGSKWAGSTSALIAFVNDPASDGISVGLDYFPIDAPPDGKSCNYRHYDDLAVPFAPLPASAAALVSSIDDAEPSGASTPTYGALKGALFAATAAQDAHADHKVVVVLASDGDPNSCDGDENDIPVIASLAQSAFNYNGVQTYVIAVQGSSVPNLDQIAAAGGTGASFDVTQDVTQFAQKMADIRAAALGCEFVVPPAPDGAELDPGKVNVAYTAGGQSTAETLPHADGPADCGGAAGWYYDNNASPTKIELCPASCAVVQADREAAVKVLLGCKTEVN